MRTRRVWDRFSLAISGPLFFPPRGQQKQPDSGPRSNDPKSELETAGIGANVPSFKLMISLQCNPTKKMNRLLLYHWPWGFESTTCVCDLLLLNKIRCGGAKYKYIREREGEEEEEKDEEKEKIINIIYY